MSLERYNQIAKKDVNFNPIKINTFIPNPNDFDYKRGYITRYFAQKINDSKAPILEIDAIGFTKLTNNAFYITTNIDWKIIGEDDEIKDANKKSIKLGMKTIRALELYLPNLLQFRKPKD